jgi:hypothetical protein
MRPDDVGNDYVLGPPRYVEAIRACFPRRIVVTLATIPDAGSSRAAAQDPQIQLDPRGRKVE